ncbi:MULTISPECIES: amino acid ABC transporter ATP-binding/permease protein [unclassified Pseudobutyrivibrio]|uniref:amino acid ABC transporter ATP-binding/permease protein n=1 Tax=unclassified Pseudobutyrivibrio TaxID=2638619 RepID=UPI0005D28AB7|nr:MULTISPECIES: ABC transporter ATP-binding protein [unclassified Pseudobutyrivibrio]SES78584.1 ATP-binding cassette, subfamily C [Pseudobutyrivibrio sp. C4]
MKNQTSGLKIMARLIGLVKPLIFIMILGILLGSLGHLCAIFVTVLGAEGIVMVINSLENPVLVRTLPKFFQLIVVVAILRGLLHYGEQYCNHYIAFRILAIIRHKVFDKLRVLCPAKLETKEKGNLITMITTDIELLEVFFAHTISPIAIAIIVSLFMSGFLWLQYPVAGIIAAIAYLTVGGMIPVSNEMSSAEAGLKFRNKFGKMNSFILGALYGIDDTIQFKNGHKQLNRLNAKSDNLAEIKSDLVDYEKNQKLLTNLSIQAFSLIILAVMVVAYNKGRVSFEQVMIAVVGMMSSFGPVVALASLSNNLNQTLASGERVLALLDEKPLVEEETDGVDLEMVANSKGNIATVNNVSFAYEDVEVIKDRTIDIPKGQILGIHGPSGCGKSTLLRLLMGFWKPDKGQIYYYDKTEGPIQIGDVNTASLRKNQSFVTQETWISQDTIAKNIAVAKPDATIEEIMEAAKKASIHEFIMSLPEGYDTKVGELGSTLSGGEKQRIGIARAFLHGGNMLLLDEPTSSLDSLNEGIILKSLKEEAKDKTVVLISHRKSTMGVADSVIDF